MDPQLAATLLGLAAVLTAVGELIRQVRSQHKTMDGRLGELLELTRKLALAEGELRTRRRRVVKIPTTESVELPSSRAGKLPLS